MPVWLTEHEHRVLSAVCDRLVPSEPGKPSASSAGAPDDIDQLLGAFLFEPGKGPAGAIGREPPGAKGDTGREPPGAASRRV